MAPRYQPTDASAGQSQHTAPMGNVQQAQGLQNPHNLVQAPAMFHPSQAPSQPQLVNAAGGAAPPNPMLHSHPHAQAQAALNPNIQPGMSAQPASAIFTPSSMYPTHMMQTMQPQPPSSFTRRERKPLVIVDPATKQAVNPVEKLENKDTKPPSQPQSQPQQQTQVQPQQTQPQASQPQTPVQPPPQQPTQQPQTQPPQQQQAQVQAAPSINNTSPVSTTPTPSPSTQPATPSPNTTKAKDDKKRESDIQLDVLKRIRENEGKDKKPSTTSPSPVSKTQDSKVKSTTVSVNNSMEKSENKSVVESPQQQQSPVVAASPEPVPNQAPKPVSYSNIVASAVPKTAIPTARQTPPAEVAKPTQPTPTNGVTSTTTTTSNKPTTETKPVLTKTESKPSLGKINFI